MSSITEFFAEHKAKRHLLKESQKDEVILIENHRRFVLFPIKYHEVYDAYKQREALFWTAEELDFTKDIENFNGEEISEDEKEYITRLLALFASNDMDKLNLTENLSAEVQIPEAKCFYGFQIMLDNIHQEVYSLIIDAIIKDNGKRVSMFDDLKKLSNINDKLEYAKTWFENEDHLFGEKLIAFAAVQGIFSLAAYASIFSPKGGKLFPGLQKGVQNMFRDRALHTDFQSLMYAHLKHDVDPVVVNRIITDAVKIEKASLKDTLPIEKFGLKIAEMEQLIEHVADFLLVSFGAEKEYNVANPFPFMEKVAIPGNTNSFAKKVADYHKASDIAQTSTNEKKDGEANFSMTEDF
ncbi:hypothetical protein TPHA_0E03220 [Tetrapisispora phaffii CBS 4417]|uniref:Uncharacterized protein n=1 Tax=Tetrapisispora phaffii (strain ATCC 24235 / CBS 4417 / NBRC 1672 / NRRL Y-8282 / UCD 70-5) TaxID=1071381 RepID=G8BU34_TETPH|nr:hypothetical protein TPHA_0E03220 [Tetrapisispora phaffii CBS 4417]CCE63412.1 hypothetical protein TPHA_0E03220 [Tetrapisispora phaffii CBS 4417]